MRQFMILAKKDLLEQIRSKKLLILIFVFLFVAIGSPILAKLTPLILNSLPATPGLVIKLPEPTYLDAIDQFVKNTSQIAILVLVFVAAGAIVDEKNRRNLEVLLSKPVSRTKFILSKFVSYLGLLSLVFIGSCFVFYYYTITTFTSFDLARFMISAVLILLYMLMVVSITIFASTFVKNTVSAAGIGFASYIFFGSIFGLIKQITDYSPNYIFSHYRILITNGWDGAFLAPTVLIVGIIFLSVLGAVLTFSKQEIER